MMTLSDHDEKLISNIDLDDKQLHDILPPP
jgi:hypothetical protein